MVKGLPKLTLKKKKKTYSQDESLEHFNRHYGVTFCFDEESIDLTNIPKGAGLYLIRDLNRIKFENCTKLYMSIPLSDAKNLMPMMPNLKTLGLVYNTINRLFLRTQYFKNVEELDLTGNEITRLDSIKFLKNLPSLKTINLSANPVCSISDEKTAIVEYFKPIDIIFN